MKWFRDAMICIIIYSILSVCAYAEDPDAMSLGNGESYSLFQVTPDREIYFELEENRSSLFFSRNSLYHLNLETMSAEKVFSLPHQDSWIYVNDEILCIRRPYSLLNTLLTTGPCAWYVLPWNDEMNSGNQGDWTFLADQSEIHYIMAGGMLYQIRDDDDGYCELRDASGTEIILPVDDVGYFPRHTLIVIWANDENVRDVFQVYDPLEKRVIEVPYSGKVMPDALIANRRLFYADNYRVISYSMFDGTSKVIFESEADQALDLCMDRSSLFIIENGEESTLYEYDMHMDKIVATINLPQRMLGYSYLVVDGILLAGNRSVREFSAFDLSTGERFDIALN